MYKVRVGLTGTLVRSADAVSATSVTNRQRLIFLAKLLVSFGLVSAIIISEGPARLWNGVSQENLLYAAAAIFLLLLQYPLAAWRWHLVLRALGTDSRIMDLMRFFWIGQFITQVMPTFIAGDGARLWYARRRGMPMRAALSGLLWDRAIGLVGLALIVLIMTPRVVDVVDDRSTMLAIRYVALGTILGYLTATAFGVLIHKRALAGPWLRRLRDLMADAWHIARSGSPFVLSLLAATFTNVLLSLAAWVLANGAGIDFALYDALALVPVGLFATLLPISVAGWGVREVSLTYMLSFVGISSADALSVSILLGGALMVASLPGAYFLNATRSSVLPDPEALGRGISGA